MIFYIVIYLYDAGYHGIIDEYCYTKATVEEAEAEITRMLGFRTYDTRADYKIVEVEL